MKMHFQTRLFIPNPYVVRVDHGTGDGFHFDLKEFRRVLSSLKKTVTSTWGYSDPIWERHILPEDNTLTISTPTYYNAVNVHVFENRQVSYWVFSDTIDALQLKLIVGDKSMSTQMWPSNLKFTITEYETQ